MKIGIGLPNVAAVADSGNLLLDWARAADAAGFSTLASLGRIAWPAYEELILLSAAAAATHTIQLSTNLLLGPTREPVLLAMQAATLDQVSGGRFVLGIGLGSRRDDYQVSGSQFSTRGRRMDAATRLMHEIWQGRLVNGSPEPIGPRPVQGERVPMIFPGHTDAGLNRAARWGIGVAQGSAAPESLPAVKARLEPKWAQYGRLGEPYYRASSYFVLGDEMERAHQFILSHYRAHTTGVADAIWVRTPRTSEQVIASITAYERIGWDEFILIPVLPDLRQLELLASVALS